MSRWKCKHLFVLVQACFFLTYFVIWQADWVGLEARTVWLCDTRILQLRIQILLYSVTAHDSILQHLWQTSTVFWMLNQHSFKQLSLSYSGSEKRAKLGWAQQQNCSNASFLGRQESLEVRKLQFHSESTGCSCPFWCETWEVCELFIHAPFPSHLIAALSSTAPRASMDFYVWPTLGQRFDV